MDVVHGSHLRATVILALVASAGTDRDLVAATSAARGEWRCGVVGGGHFGLCVWIVGGYLGMVWLEEDIEKKREVAVLSAYIVEVTDMIL